MSDVFVCGAVRTPIGRYGGSLKDVRPDELAACVIRAIVERAGIDPSAVDDVYFGDANQAGEDNRNVARMAALLAGLPVEVPGATVNRLCGSGLQAVISAAREIQVGASHVMIAGGVESMTRAPYVMLKPDAAFERGNHTVWDSTLGWRMVNPRMEKMYPTVSLGQTAENVAMKYEITREEQDRFALCSHQRAIASQDTGLVDEEIVSIDVPVRGGTAPVERDEGPRRDTSLEALARLRPAFAQDGSVTAGNSSSLNDGAAAVLLASGDSVRRHGLPVLARFVDGATAGVEPGLMGIGPVPATRKLLTRHDLEASELDIVEMNEAFASQVLACVRELSLREDQVNPNGGAIALGHPLGASGARLVTSLVHQMRRTGARRGLATMCIGVGQGISAVFESPAA